jgi:NTE family protein
MPRIGVAFGGGGMRGLAHLGVLQVMEEARIRVDLAAGTSIGGLVAGLYAAGIPLRELLEFAEEVGMRQLVSLDRARRGLSDQKRVAALLTSLLGDQDVTFEDLDIPAAVIAADIETSELVILDSGPLIPALMATSALPPLFAPVRHQGRWLVDGGMLNNLPVDVVRRMGADRVLGIDVPARVSISPQEDFDDGSSGRGLFSQGRGNRDWRLPFLIAEVSTGIAKGLINRTRLALCPADLLIEVPSADAGLFAKTASAEIVQSGRLAAKKHLDELVALGKRPLPPPWLKRLASFVGRLIRSWRAWHAPPEQLYPAPARWHSSPTEGQRASVRPEPNAGHQYRSGQRFKPRDDNPVIDA